MNSCYKSESRLRLLLNSSQKNKGSTLITVIVVVAFISILATIMLYLAGENYKTKVYDLKAKEGFYEAEEVVELVRSQLIKDVAQASADAYSEISVNYVSFGDKDARSTAYYEAFKERFSELWKLHWSNYDVMTGYSYNSKKGIAELFCIPGDAEELESKISISPQGCEFDITINGNLCNCIIDNTFMYEKSAVIARDGTDDSPDVIYEMKPEDYSIIDDTDNTVKRYYIKDLKITVIDSKGYSAVISTSFEITPPRLNFDSSDITDPSKNSVKDAYDIYDISKCVQYYDYSKE